MFHRAFTLRKGNSGEWISDQLVCKYRPTGRQQKLLSCWEIDWAPNDDDFPSLDLQEIKLFEILIMQTLIKVTVIKPTYYYPFTASL
jgi:hypothetical protein